MCCPRTMGFSNLGSSGFFALQNHKYRKSPTAWQQHGHYSLRGKGMSQVSFHQYYVRNSVLPETSRVSAGPATRAEFVAATWPGKQLKIYTPCIRSESSKMYFAVL